MTHFAIDSDISVARCLSPSFYLESSHFESSKERIFSRTWQFAGHRDEGNKIFPVTLLEDFLDEPLLVTDNGKLNCMSNVCTHRGNLLVSESCKGDSIRCGYHGRRFDLSGKFMSMPEFEGVRDFPGPEDDLAGAEIHEIAGLMFVSINPADSFENFFGPVLERLTEIQGRESILSSRVYELDAHWALYCENYLEGFHIPYVHKSLNREIDFASYETQTYRFSSLQTVVPAGAENVSGPGSEFDGKAAFYYFVFPNLMFNFYPWGLSVNVVEPLTPTRTRVRYVTIETDPSKRESGAGGDLDRVEMEDQEIVKKVQKGIRSRLYKPGRYSVKQEVGTHHFHRLIAQFMNKGEAV